MKAGDQDGERGAPPKLGEVVARRAEEGKPLSVEEGSAGAGEAGQRLWDVVAERRGAEAAAVVLVTGSTRPAELARATLALASAWAGEGRRVAIVDLFLGAPALADPRAGEREEGLGDHLLFGASWKAIERETSTRGLTLIPAGAGSPETQTVLAGEGMKDFVAELRRRHDVSLLCGVVPVEGAARHPLVDMVDGWVGVVAGGETPADGWSSSLGWIEVRGEETTPAPQPPPPGEPVREKSVEVPAAPAPVAAPRRRSRASRWPLVAGSIAAAAAVVIVWLGILQDGRAPTGPPQAGPVAVRSEALLHKPPVVEGGTASRAAEVAAAEVRRVEPEPTQPVLGAPDGGRADADEPPAAFAVHVSSYRSLRRAEADARSLESRGYETDVAEVDLGSRGRWYRVTVGRLSTRDEAVELSRQLREQEGFEYAKVVRREMSAK